MRAPRIRRNRYGRRGGGNRCGHDPRRFVRVSWKAGLPSICRVLAERMSKWALPPMAGGYARRSELTEAMQAVGPVMAARTDVASGRIGRPDPERRRRWRGLAIRADLAAVSKIGESRIERLIAFMNDQEWLHFRAVSPARRKTSRGFLRCAAQPIAVGPRGERIGLAALRVWTDKVWHHYGLTVALSQARAKLTADAQKERDVINVPVRPLVERLIQTLALAAPPRPPP